MVIRRGHGAQKPPEIDLAGRGGEQVPPAYDLGDPGAQIVGNNGQLFDTTDVIDTYVFRSLMTTNNIGMTTAAALYQSAVCFIVIILVNAVVKKIDADYALF